MGNFNANVNTTTIEESLAKTPRQAVKKSDFDTKNYLDTKLADGQEERTVTIRILPVSNEDGNFRIAVKTHNLKVSRRIAQSGFKSFLCLDDPQVPIYSPSVRCPICQKSQELFEEAKKYRESDPEKSKAIFKKACTLKSKITYIVRVIERGKENEGVKFWRFNENTQGKGIYDSLINLYKQRKRDMEEEGVENYNIFDLDNGRDIVLTLKKTVRNDGQEGVSIGITDKSINKPLTTDIELGNTWINDVKKWYNAYTVKSVDYLRIVAEEKIPWYDKAQEVWIAKEEKDFIESELRKVNDKEKQNEEMEAASEVLKEHNSVIQPTIPQVNIAQEEEYDLPF